jgi:predicted DNA-binding transcriptional regulator AlpA
MRNPHNPNSIKSYLTVAQLRKRWGSCSHMFVERRLRNDADFPRPVKLGSSSIRLWAAEDIEEYEARCVARTEQRPNLGPRLRGR